MHGAHIAVSNFQRHEPVEANLLIQFKREKATRTSKQRANANALNIGDASRGINSRAIKDARMRFFAAKSML